MDAHAAPVAPAAVGSRCSVRGPVSAVNTVRQTTRLADGTVVRLALPGSTDAGGRWQTSCQQTQISLSGRSGAEVELQGLVSRLPSATRFVVDGVTVDAGNPTVDGGLPRDSRVAVKGVVRDGVWQATRVPVEGPVHTRSFELRGMVASIDRSTLSMVVQVAGRSTTVSLARSDLVFERGVLADLAAGATLRVTGQLAADRLVLAATRIRVGDGGRRRAGLAAGARRRRIGPSPLPGRGFMATAPARRALTDSALCLATACAAVAMFLPPWVTDTVASVPRTVATALALALALLLHWVFLGLGAQRMGRPALGWVALAVLLFPVGSAAALILLAWLLHEPEARPSAAH